MASRQPLSVERIVAAAARVADESGLAAVSMRSVARAVGVEAMSLYHHVAGKEALLDLLVDWVFGQLAVIESRAPWRPAMRERARNAREILARHPWALGILDSRSAPGVAVLRHHDSVLGCLRANGFPVHLAAHAYAVLDAYVYGFVLTEVSLPFGESPEAPVSAEGFIAGAAFALEDYPHLRELVETLVTGQSYAYGDEFSYGLELILDGLDRALFEAGASADRAAVPPDADGPDRGRRPNSTR